MAATRTAAAMLETPGPGFIRILTSAERAAAPPRIPLTADAIAKRFSGAIAASREMVIDKEARGAAK